MNNGILPRDHLDGLVKLVKRTARFWWLAVITLVVGAGATLVGLRLYHPRYQSEAVVYYQEGIQWNFGGGEPSTRRIGQRLKDTLLSRSRLAKVIEELRLYPTYVRTGRIEQAVEEARRATTFKISEGDIFTIGYTGDTPDEAQQVAAKLTDMMIDENMRLRSEQAEVTEGFLAAEKKRNEDDLRATETDIARFLAKHPEFAVEQQGLSGAAVRASAKKGGTEATAAGGDPALPALRREEERLRRQISNPGEVRVSRDPKLIAAKNDAEARLASAKRDLADKRARYTEQHPDVRAAAAVVREAEDALQRATDALKIGEGTAPDVVEIEPRAALEARLAQVQQEIRDSQRKNAKGTSTTVEKEPSDTAQRIVALETEWATLNRRLAEARDRFQQLDTKQFMASMAASSLNSGQAAKIVVIDPAYKPAKPMGISARRLLFLGLAGSLGLGLGIAFLFAILDDRVYDRGDVEKLALAPVLVEVSSDGLGKRRRVRV